MALAGAEIRRERLERKANRLATVLHRMTEQERAVLPGTERAIGPVRGTAEAGERETR